MPTHRTGSGVLLILMVTWLLVGRSAAAQCKWANENCENDAQCCSLRCVKLHTGTEPRCANSRLNYPCIFNFQCEDGLACGKEYACCAPFWGVCTKTEDCCESEHVCREESGVIYRRCLFNRSITIVPQFMYLLINVVLVFICAYIS